MFCDWLRVQPRVLGMVHLRPLPGSPLVSESIDAIEQRAIAEAQVLAAHHVDALLIENFGDVPFAAESVPPITLTVMSRIARELKREIGLPLGINVLRNDSRGALAVAVAAGAEFIRVNVLSGARVTDQGVVAGRAEQLLRERAALDARRVAILADVAVKHSAPLAARPLADEVTDLIERSLADAIIVTGAATGGAIDRADLELVAEAAEDTPVLLGSGVTPANVAELMPWADGVIVGSALKRDGKASETVDPARVAEFMNAWRAWQPS